MEILVVFQLLALFTAGCAAWYTFEIWQRQKTIHGQLSELAERLHKTETQLGTDAAESPAPIANTPALESPPSELPTPEPRISKPPMEEQQATIYPSTTSAGPPLNPDTPPKTAQPDAQHAQPTGSPDADLSDRAKQASRVAAASFGRPIKKDKSTIGRKRRTAPEATTTASGRSTVTPAGAGMSRIVPPEMGLEERLGSRIFVYLGGIALALASVFFVKIVIESGWITPRWRVILGAAAGISMIGIGEKMRLRSDNICQALSGAGVAALFASVMASVKLYGFLGPVAGLALVGIITLVAVVLSMRHGKFVALLGLLGGFLLPVFIRDSGPIGPTFFAYLLVLEVGTLVVAHKQNWQGISTATLVATLAWTCGSAIGLVPPIRMGMLTAFTITSAVAYIVANARQTHDNDGWAWTGQAIVSSLAALAIVTMAVFQSDFQRFDTLVLLALSIGTITLARWDQRYTLIPWLSAVVSCVTMAAYHQSVYHAGGNLVDVNRMFLLFGVAFGLGSYLALHGSRQARIWAALCGLSVVTFFLNWRFTVSNSVMVDPWMVGPALACAMTLLSAPIYRRRLQSESAAAALPSLVLATNALATLGLMDGVADWDVRWWSVGFALLTLAVAWTRVVLPIPQLRFAVIWNAVLTIAACVLPGVFFDSYGDHVIFNKILLQFGMPAVSFMLTVAPLRQTGHGRLADAARALGACLAIATVVLLVRHGFHPETFLWHDPATMLEWATYAITGLAGGLLIAGIGEHFEDELLRRLGFCAGTIGMFISFTASAFLMNPLWTAESVGTTPVINWLLYIFGIPAALTAVWGHAMANAKLDGTQLVKSFAMLLLFALVSLNVRQGFVGEFLSLGATKISTSEWYGYSLAWILLSLGMLAMGMVTGGVALRYGSLVIMLLAIAKVFAMDTIGLTGMLRVASYAGLGMSLMAVGYVYQRFVFRRSFPVTQASLS